MKAAIFDCEVIRAIPSRKEPPIQGVEYCGGWTDYVGMNISVIGAYIYSEDRYAVFCKDNFSSFASLVEDSDVLLGFNSLGFDNKLIKACLDITVDLEAPDGLPIVKSYDLLSEVWKAAGLPAYFAGSKSGGYGLDACAVANGLPGKSGSGAMAPVLWQQGKIGELIDYCLRDVWITKKLIDMVLAGPIADPKTGRPISVRKPW